VEDGGGTMMKFLLQSLVLLLSLALPANAYVGPQQLGIIASLRGANFNVTTDQAIVIPAQITKFVISGVYVTNCSVSMSTAAGGIYTAAAKGGTAVVAASTTYASLTTATVMQNVALTAAAGNTAWTVSSLFFSLTTAHGSAGTCDIFVLGLDLT
jgi:hypothetical protein